MGQNRLRLRFVEPLSVLRAFFYQLYIMKHSIAFLTFVIAASPLYAERHEVVTLFKGTPDTVSWERIVKSGRDNTTFHIRNRFFNQDEEKNSANTWKIPAFDTKGGTRRPTGFSVNYSNTLEVTLHGDAGTIRNRKIEEYFLAYSTTATISSYDKYVDDKIYYYPHDYVTYDITRIVERIPKDQQQEKIDLELSRATSHDGWTIRNSRFLGENQSFKRIITGKSSLEMGGYIRWNPTYEFDRIWEDGTPEGSPEWRIGAPCATNQWEIPGNDPTKEYFENISPLDSVGRRLDLHYGLPEYPLGCDIADYTVYSPTKKTGTAKPINVEFVYHYTQVGDADHDPSNQYSSKVYGAAGEYADGFSFLDNHGDYNPDLHPNRFKIPGNMLLEPAEFNFTINDKRLSGEIQLYYYTQSNVKNVVYGANGLEHFTWMDTDHDGVINMEEYRIWRDYLKAVKKTYPEPWMKFPNENWATFPTPAELLAKLNEQDPASLTVLHHLDTNKNQTVSRGEWNSSYLKKIKKETQFDLIDRNKDGKLTAQEITANLKNKKKSSQLIWLQKRSKIFVELDQNKNKQLSLKEISSMWPPTTKKAEINRFWKKMGNKTLTSSMSFTNWMKAKTLPSFNSYKKAKALRAESSS